MIWDEGTHDAVSWEDRKVVVELRGRRARGRYALFRPGATSEDWVLAAVGRPSG